MSINPCHLLEEISHEKVDLPSLASGSYTFLKGGYIAYISKGEVHIKGNGLLILPKVVNVKLTLEAYGDGEMEVKGTFISSRIKTIGQVHISGSFTGCLKDLERLEKPVTSRRGSVLSIKREGSLTNTPTMATLRNSLRLWKR